MPLRTTDPFQFPVREYTFDAAIRIQIQIRYCRCLRLSVCPSAGLSILLVRTITRHKFELESQNLHQTCVPGYSRLVLRIGVIYLDFQGHFGHFDLKFLQIRIVHVITRHRFWLESPYLHQTSIMWYSRLVLKMGVIDLDLQGHCW